MIRRTTHEPNVVAARKLHWIIVALGAGLVAIMLLMYLLAHTWLKTSEPPITAIPPQPRLQSRPAVDLAAERAREQALLDSYGWVDRDAGVARIPVERAMELLVRDARGLRAKTGEPR